MQVTLLFQKLMSRVHLKLTVLPVKLPSRLGEGKIKKKNSSKFFALGYLLLDFSLQSSPTLRHQAADV